MREDSLNKKDMSEMLGIHRRKISLTIDTGRNCKLSWSNKIIEDVWSLQIENRSV